jgi:hypothetical protein
MNAAIGETFASHRLNADIKNVIAYGVQVKIKPKTVIIIPKKLNLIKSFKI